MHMACSPLGPPHSSPGGPQQPPNNTAPHATTADVQAQTRRPLLAAAGVLFAVWAVGGFYGSRGPTLIDHLVG